MILGTAIQEDLPGLAVEYAALMLAHVAVVKFPLCRRVCASWLGRADRLALALILLGHYLMQ